MVAADFAQATRFLSLLDPAGIFTFQTFPESGEGKVHAAVLHGSLDQHAGQLRIQNEHGAGVFVMVNAGDGVARAGAKTCRTSANVQRVRAVFVDLDGAPIAPILESALPPDWIVLSSPGRWHAYWRVDDCPLDRFESVQKSLAIRFEGDPKVKDLPRVMRMPGFIHRKSNPFRSELREPTSYMQILETSHD